MRQDHPVLTHFIAQETNIHSEDRQAAHTAEPMVDLWLRVPNGRTGHYLCARCRQSGNEANKALDQAPGKPSPSCLLQ
jgi:hypothetical protein